MAWVAVNKYGDEYIFEDKPKKVGHRKSDDFNIYFEEVFDSNGNPVGVIGVDIEPVENKRFYGKFDDLTQKYLNLKTFLMRETLTALTVIRQASLMGLEKRKERSLISWDGAKQTSVT